MAEFNSHRLFSRRASEAVTANQVAATATGNSYAISTDNSHYVLLCFISPVFDENIFKDAEYLVPFYLNQGCFCVTMWFRDENVSMYLNKAPYVMDPTQKYYAFFNASMLQTAVDIKKQFSIMYSAAFKDPYIFCTIDEEGQQHVYQTYGNKAKELSPNPPDLDYKFGRYYGYVEKAEGKKEFIFSYALDIS